MRLEARNLAAGYGSGFRIEDVDLVIEERRITGLVGPNGAGKSTLLRVLSRILKPMRGVVLLDGEVLHQLPNREVAKRLAFLGQPVDGLPDLTVEELAYRGRYPHQSLLQRNGTEDAHSVEWALGAMNMTSFRHRPLRELSHGELRRAWMTMGLAQRPDILLLDEPTAFLDLSHQFELMDLLSELKDHGVTVVISMHELWLASLYCHRIIAMREGRVTASGPTEEVLTVELLGDVFGVEVAVREHPLLPGKTIALPYARRREPKPPAVVEPAEHVPPVPTDVESPHSTT
ncbi:MAG: ABC transporter ATP-binding protein [Chloroflexi bacterium]|nr:ABC transporter ATP-binding protein [Chloroflexota bacterium]